MTGRRNATVDRIAVASMAAALLLNVPPPLRAQTYPKAPINLVIPLAAGDATDTFARALAEDLSRELKVPIVPVNRPGAGGALGTGLVVRAKNDGYTIVVTNNAALIYRSILDPATASYDPLKDLTPLGLAMRSPSILVVRGDAPYKTFNELVEYAKKHPRTLRIGTAGVGSVGDFSIRTINALTGAELTMVPFTGASPAITALLGAHVEGVVLALGTLTSHLKNGALRGIVISSRYPDFPDIPTLADLGYAQPLFGIWVAFFAPAGVPVEVSNVLVPALEHAISAPAMAAKLKPLGMLPDYAAPDQLLAEIRDEHRRVEEMARKAGLLK